MQKLIIRTIYALSLIMLLLTSCSPSAQPGPKTTNSPDVNTNTTSGGYPPAEETTDISGGSGGYPAPSEGLLPTSVSATETVNPSLGQVKGTFQMQNKPMQVFVLYLAPTVKDNTGQEIVVNFDRSASISAVPDENGQFTFINVPPGRYGLVYDAISSSYLMSIPGKQETLLITVNGSETIDLGVLKYENPPN